MLNGRLLIRPWRGEHGGEKKLCSYPSSATLEGMLGLADAISFLVQGGGLSKDTYKLKASSLAAIGVKVLGIECLDLEAGSQHEPSVRVSCVVALRAQGGTTSRLRPTCPTCPTCFPVEVIDIASLAPLASLDGG